MADALISIVLKQLSNYAVEEVKLTVGVRQAVVKLTTNLKILKAVLDDAEEKQVKNKAVKAWLKELRDISYDANDVLDEWQTRTTLTSQSQLRVDDAAVFRNKVLSYLLSPCSCFTHVSVRYDIGHRIKEISERLDVITAMKEQYGLKIIQKQEEPRQQTSSLVDVLEIRGRDHDKDVIMSWLLSESSHQDLRVCVISIVGMGGFGKTALAKLLFNEEKVVTAFDQNRMWVCVSDPFDQIGVAKAIIEEAKETVPDSNTWEAFHHRLCDSIKGKRFLLVLDDVWTDNPNHWSELKLSLDGGAPGSRIIVTTRNEGVAKTMGSTHVHNLGKLSEDDSWQLLRAVALKGREEELENFERTGKEIAMKCKGVPLAIKTLASLLFQKRSIQDWRDVLASDLWEEDLIEKNLLPSFFLSYYSLPSCSKQCFMYCAIFPKDTEMGKDDLVKLWMAQGFLGSGGTIELEKIGQKTFDDLVMRSFFQDFEKDSDGNITCCKIHDLVHDFAQFLTQGEYSSMEINDTKFEGKKLRHLSTEKLNNPSIYEAKKLRSLIRRWTWGNPIGDELQTLVEKLSCLRTLDLSDSGLKELPNEIEKLLHLRYLNLSHTNLLELPETVSNLYNLQTLKLNWCQSLRKLPDGIGNLLNLRHLEIYQTNELSCLPRGVSRLCFLRTLSKFNIGGECKIGDLQRLNNLQGNLEIWGLELISDVNEASQAAMKKKKNLGILTLRFEDLEGGDVGRMKDVLEKLEPHENLEMLVITGYPGYQFPCWMGNRSLLYNIVNMEISDCKQLTELPTLGKLASLVSLEISSLPLVKRVGLEFLGISDDDVNERGSLQVIFPKLTSLTFASMEEWEEWKLPFEKDIIIVMPCLSKVEISNCPKLNEIPHYLGFPHTLKDLTISNCPELKGMQPCLPPLMEKLWLYGDAGVFSKSLPVNNECSIRSVGIIKSPHSSLPMGFNQLKAVQQLYFSECESLDFKLKELEHLTILQDLYISACPLLKERFQQGKDWRSILSHVATIIIDDAEITGRATE